MKWKLLLSGLLLILVIMVGCGKKEEAIPSAEAFINAEFYLTDFEQYEKSFGKRVIESNQNSVMEQLSEQLRELGLAEADSQKAADAMFKALKDKTSYQVAVLSEDQEKTTFEARITGLAMDKFEENLQQLSVNKILELVKEAGIEGVEKEADLTHLTSKADVEKVKEVLKAFHEDPQKINQLMIQGIEELETASQSKTVSFTLVTNPDRKKYWQVKDQQKVIDDITNILILPY